MVQKICIGGLRKIIFSSWKLKDVVDNSVPLQVRKWEIEWDYDVVKFIFVQFGSQIY